MKPITKFILLVSAGVGAMAASEPTPLVDGEALRIGPGEFVVQAPEREGPVTLIDAETIRFRVLPGDKWAMDNGRGAPRERAEISGQEKIAYGDTARASIDLRLSRQEMGGYGRWMTITQLHGPNRRTLEEDTALRSPPFAVQVRGDQLVFTVRGGVAGDEEASQQRIGSIPADFDQWHRYDFDVQMGENGRVTILRDGEIAIDWTGPVGYDAGDGMHYWKFGIYRSAQWQGPSQLDLRIACAGSLEGCIADTP